MLNLHSKSPSEIVATLEKKGYLESTSLGIVSMASIDDKLNRVEIMIKNALSVFGVAGSRAVNLKWQHDIWHSFFAMLQSQVKPGPKGDCIPRCLPTFFILTKQRAKHDAFALVEKVPSDDPHIVIITSLRMLAKCGNNALAGRLAVEASRLSHGRHHIKKYLRMATGFYREAGSETYTSVLSHRARELKRGGR